MEAEHIIPDLSTDCGRAALEWLRSVIRAFAPEQDYDQAKYLALIHISGIISALHVDAVDAAEAVESTPADAAQVARIRERIQARLAEAAEGAIEFPAADGRKGPRAAGKRRRTAFNAMPP